MSAADENRFLGKSVSGGRYRLEKFIGGGGFGAVYEGVDTRLGGPVAIKLSTSPDISENSFKREAKLLHSVTNESVVGVKDYGHSDELHAYFIVMEHVNGTPLEKILAKGPLPSAQLAELALQIGDALEEVHNQHTAHRDLSANNILQVNVPVLPGRVRRSPWRYVLIDFGLSAKFDAQKSLGAATTKGFGTPEYMPPEMFQQTSDGELNFETAVCVDIYGFGTILYRALTGVKPFEMKRNSLDGLAELVSQIKNTPAVPPSQVCANERLTPEIDELILSCLAKNPKDRPKSTFEVGKLLADMLVVSAKTGPITLYSDKSEGKTGSRIPWLFVALFLLLAMGSLAIPQVRQFAGQLTALGQNTAPVVPQTEVSIFPLKTSLVADGHKELVVRVSPPNKSLIETLDIQIVDSDQKAITLPIQLLQEELGAGEADSALQFRVQADLNCPAFTGKIRVTSSDPSLAGREFLADLQVQSADYWRPDDLSEIVQCTELKKLKGEDRPVSKQLIIKHPKLPDPLTFMLIDVLPGKDANESSEYLDKVFIYMMENKVTRRDFWRFLQDVHPGSPNPWEGEPGTDLFPATGININLAAEYAHWLAGKHGTLPSEAEWFWAAGYGDARSPKGPYEAVVAGKSFPNRLGPVGTAFPQDISVFKIRDMAVNGSEYLRTVNNFPDSEFPLKEGKLKPSLYLGGSPDSKDLTGQEIQRMDFEMAPGYAPGETQFVHGEKGIGFRVVIVRDQNDTRPEHPPR